MYGLTIFTLWLLPMLFIGYRDYKQRVVVGGFLAMLTVFIAPYLLNAVALQNHLGVITFVMLAMPLVAFSLSFLVKGVKGGAWVVTWTLIIMVYHVFATWIELGQHPFALSLNLGYVAMAIVASWVAPASGD